MLVRYGKKKNGSPEKIAEIYTLKEHGIRREDIDPEAVSIIRRLSSHGYRAYIVGGAVRDLLLGKKPKDFDLATDAIPGRIRAIFKNSRIIGRRFPLVHVYYPDKIIEVSTFRDQRTDDISRDGSAAKDARTRDFSVNALFYDPEKEQVIDFVGAMKDMEKKVINPLLSLDTIFLEDPVRMLRAVRYGVLTGFSLNRGLRVTLIKQTQLLSNISSSRLTEELFKMLSSGFSLPIFSMMADLGLFDKLLPVCGSLIEAKGAEKDVKLPDAFFRSLETLDELVKQEKPVKRSAMVYYLMAPFVEKSVDWKENRELLYRDCFYKVKELLNPLTPPNAEVEGAVRMMFVERHLQPLHRRFAVRG
ncbi:MAG: polynucleotide adenylyltransferase PcnB [Spirochaetales bacterium]|nr:MAG: polynucleotide adenylyltransferase PcnB [Spirochaetales bacterium]